MRLTDPKAMRELMADGWTRDQVYAAVKRGELVNLNRLDAWGRIRRGPGLFAAPAGPGVNFTPLRDAWGRSCS
jgi:hypothetical protein